MNDFYRDDQTRAAQTVLGRLQKIVPDAVILGGWAVFLYTHGQRSTDVDIAVDFPSFSQLQSEFGALITKNNNLRKYELVLDNVEIDILVIHFSNAGIAIEELLEPSRRISGFRVMSPEGLLAMKLCAWIDRAGRVKGDKDEADVLSLLSVIQMDWERYRTSASKLALHENQRQGDHHQRITVEEAQGRDQRQSSSRSLKFLHVRRDAHDSRPG